MMMITLRRKLKRGEVQNKTKVKSPTGDKFAISEEGSYALNQNFSYCPESQKGGVRFGCILFIIFPLLSYTFFFLCFSN